MNFATLKGLTIPQGVVKQITDSSGRILWSASKPIVLTVEKVTATTYAGETAYNDEQFILLEIYPKTNGTVKVTYGGLTKTITDTSGAESPNAQQVYFGTFNGVSDSVATPSSGTLTIDGDCDSFACGSYSSGSKSYDIGYCDCITSVQEFGEITSIGSRAFYNCNNLVSINIPSSIISIGSSAFYNCNNLVLTSIPGTVKIIGQSAFYKCKALQFSDSFFCEGLERIEDSAFIYIDGWADGDNGVQLYNVTIPKTVTYIGNAAFHSTSDPKNDISHPIFKQITFLSQTPPTVTDTSEYGVFGQPYISSYGNYTFKIIVPKGCADIYKNTTGLAFYANYIEEAS